MLTAQQKRKENIVEYILYLYQIEDLIRAFQFNISAIEANLISQYQTEEKIKKEITEWYKNLVVMMEKERIQEKGHLQFLTNLINDINELHLKLMESGVDSVYVSEFQSISGLITELSMKGNSAKNDVQTSLDAVYGFLLLKMQKKEITEETTEAIKRLSSWLATLSGLFKDFESGDLDFE
ncbi:MAG TPA: DUF4924 family protein [Draconibacterium sp.]|nr:DUF4924 family protein [Draconibacterium sp.]